MRARVARGMSPRRDGSRASQALTSSACFCAALSKPLRESLRQAASWLKDSGAGCHAMVGGGAASVRASSSGCARLEGTAAAQVPTETERGGALGNGKGCDGMLLELALSSEVVDPMLWAWLMEREQLLWRRASVRVLCSATREPAARRAGREARWASDSGSGVSQWWADSVGEAVIEGDRCVSVAGRGGRRRAADGGSRRGCPRRGGPYMGERIGRDWSSIGVQRREQLGQVVQVDAVFVSVAVARGRFCVQVLPAAVVGL